MLTVYCKNYHSLKWTYPSKPLRVDFSICFFFYFSCCSGYQLSRKVWPWCFQRWCSILAKKKANYQSMTSALSIVIFFLNVELELLFSKRTLNLQLYAVWILTSEFELYLFLCINVMLYMHMFLGHALWIVVHCPL